MGLVSEGEDHDGALFAPGEPDAADDTDNITDWALGQFQTAYADPSLTKDDIWEYMYGVMHAPDWRERYKADLRRSLPRIPFAANFEAFRAAGRELMDLHVNYETCPQQPGIGIEVDGKPVEVDEAGRVLGTRDVLLADPPPDVSPEIWRIEETMRWVDHLGRKTKAADGLEGKTRLRLNSRVTLVDIPTDAHAYEVSGRSPLDWAINVLARKVDKDSGKLADPNQWDAWAGDPFELVRHLRRLAYIGVKSAEIITALPPSLDGPAVPAFADEAGDQTVHASADAPNRAPTNETND